MPTHNETRVWPQKRLPYEAPAVEETSEFETLALDCGHLPNSEEDTCDPGVGGNPQS
jgi:hypothetical protein